MSAASDDMTADPWDRVRRLGGSLEVIAENRDEERLTEARRLLDSLEQRLTEGSDGRE
ncbi:hypothetical protein [Natronomonas marina]|uniref:hypothetical protein n=1 Tax=Natronomonas marina TaxID=2961939 RepID=UPI0020C95C4A|nr:hypothetical protein [Natronomonas marina]